MTQGIKEHYDELYRNCEHKAPGPTVAVESALKHLRKGTVLDLGSGVGRNAIYLAMHGFEVTAVDISGEGLELLKEVGAKKKVINRITTVEADAGSYTPDKEYDNVICSFILHFLRKSDFMPTLDKLMKYTAKGGVNVISDLTTNGPLYKSDSIGHWIEAGELLGIYEQAGWEIIDSYTYSSSTMVKDPQGKPFQHESDHLVARKK